MPDISLKPIDNIDIKIQKTEPVVFDDSVTLYEFLGKLQHAINELVDNNNQLPEYIAQELQQNFQELYDRVAALEGRADDIEPILNTLVRNVASLTSSFEYTESVATQHLNDNDQLLDNIQDQIDGIIVGDSLNVGSMTPGTRYMIAQSILNDIKTIINEKLQTPGSEMKPDEMAAKISNIGTRQDDLSLWLEGEDGQGTITNDEMTIHARSIRPNAFRNWNNAPTTVIFGQEVQTLYDSCFFNVTRWQTLDVTLAEQLRDFPDNFNFLDAYVNQITGKTPRLSSVIFGTNKNYITKIGENAFRENYNLETFDFTKLPNLNEIGRNAFANTHVHKVDLSQCSHLSVIRERAFAYMRNALTHFILPQNATFTIEIGIFYDYSQGSGDDQNNTIDEIRIPSGCTVNYGAMDNVRCTKLYISGDDTVTVNDYNNKWTAWHGYYGSPTLNYLECNGKRFFGNGTLQGCTRLNTVKLNDCFGIGNNCFRDDNIKSITIDHLFCIGENAFYNAFDSLDPPARLKLPSDLNKNATIDQNTGLRNPSLSNQAFAGANVSEIDLSDCIYVDLFPWGMFAGSSAVTIKLPPNIKIMDGNDGFSGCTYLVNLEIPGTLENTNLTNPYAYNFRDCTSLTNITLGSNFHVDFNFSVIPAVMASTAWDATAANLRDLTGSTAKTLTMTNSQKATMSAATEAAIRAKNWTITTV